MLLGPPIFIGRGRHRILGKSENHRKLSLADKEGANQARGFQWGHSPGIYRVHLPRQALSEGLRVLTRIGPRSWPPWAYSASDFSAGNSEMQPVDAFRLWQHLRSKGAVSLGGVGSSQVRTQVLMLV